MSKLTKSALFNSLGVAAYIVAVSLLMQNGQSLFGNGNQFTSSVGVLAVVVLSAAVVGTLIFLKPVMLYLDGLKKESITLLTYTIGFFAVYTLIYLLILGILK